jgi:hypothetical protein
MTKVLILKHYGMTYTVFQPVYQPPSLLGPEVVYSVRTLPLVLMHTGHRLPHSTPFLVLRRRRRIYYISVPP